VSVARQVEVWESRKAVMAALFLEPAKAAAGLVVEWEAVPMVVG